MTLHVKEKASTIVPTRVSWVRAAVSCVHFNNYTNNCTILIRGFIVAETYSKINELVAG